VKLTKLVTWYRLGFINLYRVFFYRLQVCFGWYSKSLPIEQSVTGPFYNDNSVTIKPELPCPDDAPLLLEGKLRYFSSQLHTVGSPPDWFFNPVENVHFPSEGHWSTIGDFNHGDIKLIWEPSRFHWLVLAVQGYIATDEQQYLLLANDWLEDWCSNNPTNQGLNWKCGQESSIRVMQLAVAALILDQVEQTTSSLIPLVCSHLKRIAPTINYAIAQDNNHGTSEAAALFIGGSWLEGAGVSEGKRWARLGRRWLEDRATRLIGEQGSFSQYSLNYHRVMLDTFCLVEVWRKSLNLPKFSSRWQIRVLAATQWLRHIVNPYNGDGPNVGANDGASLLQLSGAEYRDHRPTVQLGMALFANQQAYPDDGPYNSTLHWLGVDLPQQVAPHTSHYIADDGGFAVMKRGDAMAMLRYPRFRFRPSQSDALHLDLWLGRENLLKDAGTFSYNTDKKWLDYFGGTAGHNTVQFDGRDQMPRLSRFLLGDWLKTSWTKPLNESEEVVEFGVGYRDSHGASHQRSVQLSDTKLIVDDQISGLHHKAVLRWRLKSDDWVLTASSSHQTTLVNTGYAMEISVQCDMPILRCELTEGWESRHYMEKTKVPVLEVEVDQPGCLTTEICWSK